MIGILLALLTAISFSLSIVMVRKRLNKSTALNATLMVVMVGNIVLWPLAILLTDFKAVNLESLIFFAIAGMLAPGVGRLLFYLGMERVGASVTESVFAINPLFTALLAVLFLNETLSLEIWMGIVLIVLGAILVERSVNNSKVHSPTKAGNGKILKRGLGYAIMSAFVVSIAGILRKQGLNLYNAPILGVAIGFAFSLLVYSIPFLLTKSSHYSFRKEFRLFWIAGLASIIGWLLLYFALSVEKLSIVASIIETAPLFVLFFSYVYLKQFESISFKLVVSTMFIVIGAILVGINS